MSDPTQTHQLTPINKIKSLENLIGQRVLVDTSHTAYRGTVREIEDSMIVLQDVERGSYFGESGKFHPKSRRQCIILNLHSDDLRSIDVLDLSEPADDDA